MADLRMNREISSSHFIERLRKPTNFRQVLYRRLSVRPAEIATASDGLAYLCTPSVFGLARLFAPRRDCATCELRSRPSGNRDTIGTAEHGVLDRAKLRNQRPGLASGLFCFEWYLIPKAGFALMPL